MMKSSPKLLKIKGVFKHYDWGGFAFLPGLMHFSNNEQKHYAEYWMGSDLHEGIEKRSYLFKVLDVVKMLSIQVHPNKEAARIKFEAENRKGIPLDAPYRNYKDNNHKPELLAPLSEFYLLHGFKDSNNLKAILQEVEELNFLIPAFKDNDYKKLYTIVMTMTQEEVNERLLPLLSRIIPAYIEGQYTKDEEHFWAARAALTFNTSDKVDRGIFSIYFFNVVKLYPGQALFQDAGMPHAYLEGHTMEIMANSDNVLRGGLTPKHVDVAELLEHVVFVPTSPKIIEGAKITTSEIVYPAPVKDFQLNRIGIVEDEEIVLSALSTDIYFIYQGSIRVTTGDETLELKAGEAFAAEHYQILNVKAHDNTIIYRALEPGENLA